MPAGRAGGIAEYPVPTAESAPEGMTVTGGTAWFAEADTAKIGEVTEGGSITEYPVPSKQYDSGILQGITAGPDGNLWFTTYSYIGRMTPSGSFTFYPITAYNGAYDITPGPDGNVWFTEIGGIVGYVTPGGAVTEYSLPSGSRPYYITAGKDGAVWFIDPSNNDVDRLTTSGSLTQYVLPSTWSLDDITTGGDGRLWFGSGNFALTAMTTAGVYTTYTWQEGVNAGYVPGYIRPDGSGTLVFANPYNGVIGEMTTGGSVAFTSVPSGHTNNGIAVAPDGTIWFSEPSWGANAMGMLPPGPAQFPPGGPGRPDLRLRVRDEAGGAAGSLPG